MSVMPAAIIFVNDDLTTNVKNMLVRQLHITEVIDGYTFDTRVAADNDYPTLAKNNRQRIMVVRSLEGPDNRNLVDLVLFVKAGLITVIQNNITGTYLNNNCTLPGETPTTPGSVKTKHHLYPDQLPSNYNDVNHRNSSAVSIQVVNISWGALGIY